MSSLDPPVAQRILNRLNWLAENCESVNHYALTGQHAGKFRLRIGDYRAMYWLDRENRRIEVESIGHRSEVY
jgi:mRNA interferase RelE/StbE